MTDPPAKTSNLAISTRGLTRCYGKRPVVNALDLNVPRGCVYGLLGRNGAGKSTTIKMLTGMIQPDFGTAELLGENIEQMTPATRARIAYVAEGHPMYGGMSIDAIERFQSSFYPNWNGELFGQIVEHFGLSHKQKLRKLSNGQRAQVSLALAIAPDPELLILDDPTLGLDTVVRRDFLESMIQLIQREGRTILFSSHILGDVERVADRIGILVDGVLRVDCPTDHFKESLRKVVLEFPGTPQVFPLTEGVVSDIAIGTRRELVIANYSDAHREAIGALSPTTIDFVEFNLEDAFIAYTRGDQKPLPIFPQPKQNNLNSTKPETVSSDSK